MSWIAAHAVDVVILLVVAVVVGLAVRGVVHGGAADCSSCNGSCGSCSTGCTTPKIELTPAQEERLRILRAKGGQS